MNHPSINTPLSIRLATLSDLDALTELHCACFGPEEHVPVMLGRAYVRATYRWMITSNQAYCLVAIIASKIIGLISVCDRDYTRPMFMACLPEFTVSLLRAPGLLFEKRLWSRLFRKPDKTSAGKSVTTYPGFAQLTIVAVDEEYRGTGVFRAMTEAIKEYSRMRGSRAIRVGIYKVNERSQRAFSKGGWVESPALATHDTVFYVHVIDPSFAEEIGIQPSLRDYRLSDMPQSGKV